MKDALEVLVQDSLNRPVFSEAITLANNIVAEHGTSVAAVVFYGSCLRDKTAEGVLDFYVLVDDYKGFHGSWLSATANYLLPPTVTYRHGEEARAKIAIISVDQFAKRMQPSSNDTTLWARFCQPAALLYSRDDQATAATRNAVADAITTAVVWARRLGPEGTVARDLWNTLFTHTYGAELRVEDGKKRGGLIYERSPEYFDVLVEPSIVRAQNKPDQRTWETEANSKDIRRYARSWRRKRMWGKALNIMRLIKGAFTFDQKVEYIQWKVERHTGEPLNLTDFQKKYPLLNAPVVLWRLWRKGAIR